MTSNASLFEARSSECVELSLIRWIKRDFSNCQQVSGWSGKTSGIKTKVVFSKECFSWKHGQHVVEPGPDPSKVKLSLFIQVSEWVSEAQIEVGGAPVLRGSRRGKVSGSEGSLGADGAGHRALGGQRGGRSQTGGAWNRHLWYWWPFLRLASRRGENTLIHVSLGSGRRGQDHRLGAHHPGGHCGLGASTCHGRTGLCPHISCAHRGHLLSWLCLSGGISRPPALQPVPPAAEVVLFADGGGLGGHAPSLCPALLATQLGLPGSAREPGQPQPQQVAQRELLRQWFLVDKMVKPAADPEAGQELGADGFWLCVEDSELQVKVFNHLAGQNHQVAAV